MPFLFVDYDQGMGGEYFCLELSHSRRCRTLIREISANGRIKVKDRFDQEWLKPNPKPERLDADPDLFDIVPTHGHTAAAQAMLKNLHSIRVAWPESLHLRSFIKENQRRKVVLACAENDGYFLGDLKILREQATNPDFLRQCRRNMDHASLTLISQGIEPNEENKLRYVKEMFDQVPPEPQHHYDLVIDFADLIFETSRVIQLLNQTFDLGLGNGSFVRLRQNYLTYALD